MQKASEELLFEKAIEYRELLGSVKKTPQRTKNYRQQRRRQGCSCGSDTRGGCCSPGVLYPWRASGSVGIIFIFGSPKGETCGEILNSFIKQYYATPFIPRRN